MDPIITIGREYGSGGREIGKLVADKLGVPFYDKEILTRAAEESGLCHELLERHDEKNTVSGMLAGSAGASLHVGAGGMGLQMPLNQRVFLAQFDAITKIAAEGPGVIVGRCADYVLKDRPGVTHIFIYASEERRIARMVEVSTSRGSTLLARGTRSTSSNVRPVRMFSSSIELTHPFVIIKDCGYFTSACRECQRFARPMPGLMRD